MLKLLITGGNGQLAQVLVAQANSETIIRLTKNELDITNPDAIQLAIKKHSPEMIINTAAYTAVDKAEVEKDRALEVNYLGAKHIAEACTQNQLPLIHISTDYVFNGNQNQPYRETDQINPVNHYGHSKYLGEEAIREYCKQHIILRVSGLFSECAQNFTKTILRLAMDRTELNVVQDQITCPTYAGDLAQVILEMANSFKVYGTYHYCSEQAVSWHEFASKILEIARQQKKLLAQRINPIATAAYNTTAARPAFSVLNCDKIAQDYQLQQPNWETALHKIIPILLEKV